MVVVLGLSACGGSSGDGAADVTSKEAKAKELRVAATDLCTKALDGLKAPPADPSAKRAKTWARRSAKELDQLTQVFNGLAESQEATGVNIEPMRVALMQASSTSQAVGKGRKQAIEPMLQAVATLQKEADAAGLPDCAPR